MDKSRLEWKVGLFVFVGLVLAAGLLLQFSKGTTFFRPAYEIILEAPTVSGLKPRAQVLMSGIQVGSVSAMQLASDGKSILITLRIYQQYQIYKDARFVFEQSGFLGDQYVASLPTRNQGEVFRPGDRAAAEAPLDIQKIARSAAGLLEHIDVAATNINHVLSDARLTVLSARALTNLQTAFDNFHRVSERSLQVVENAGALLDTNRPTVSTALSNLLSFSDQANEAVGDVRALLAANSSAITTSLSNIQSSTDTLKALLDNLKQGRGTVGKMLESDEIAANVSQVVSNLSITTSNLNRLGLWAVLRKPRPAPTNPPARAVLTAPKNPFP